MIFDKIENYKTYCDINIKFEKAFEFIKKAIEENFEVGNYEIDGKDIYAFIQSYDSKLKDECSFEGHRKYIDIQYIMDGCEVMGILEASDVVAKEEYNTEKDVTFFEEEAIPSYFVAKKGDFCVFYPHDIHRPSIAYNDFPSNVKKLVIKVHI